MKLTLSHLGWDQSLIAFDLQIGSISDHDFDEVAQRDAVMVQKCGQVIAVVEVFGHEKVDAEGVVHVHPHLVDESFLFLGDIDEVVEGKGGRFSFKHVRVGAVQLQYNEEALESG